jgi:hypothetical protein
MTMGSLNTEESMRYLISLMVCLSLTIWVAGCSDDPAAPTPETDNETSIIKLDSGNIGVVFDTREIFRAGYRPNTLQISFPDYPQFDTTLDIDALTNVATLTLDNDSLTVDLAMDLGRGTATTVVVLDEDDVELSRVEYATLALNDSNLPMGLDTDLPPADPTLTLKEGVPYLLQAEGADGFMALQCSDCYVDKPYVFDSDTQQHYFTEVGESGSMVFTIRNESPDYPGMNDLYMADGLFLGVRSEADGGPEEFALEPNRDGYVRIRHVDTGKYLFRTISDIQLNETGDRFRIISDNIDWAFEDLGTQFNQPIMPPAKLDFAYSGRLSNCSSATLEESVGRTESRTSTTSITTTEGLELFAQSVRSSTVSWGTTVTAGVGFEFAGIGASADVEVRKDKSWTQEFTTNQTRSRDSSWSQESSETVEVSRTRTVTVPEFTVVDVDDAVKTIENVSIPFTQILQVKATDRATSTEMTGEEIATQIRANEATCLISEVGSNYVRVSIRGVAQVDQMFNGSTLVDEVEGGCQ